MTQGPPDGGEPDAEMAFSELDGSDEVEEE